MLLLCSFFRLKELFQVKNGLTTSLLFFFENSKNVGRLDDAKRKRRGDRWPQDQKRRPKNTKMQEGGNTAALRKQHVPYCD